MMNSLSTKTSQKQKQKGAQVVSVVDLTMAPTKVKCYCRENLPGKIER